MCVSACKCPCAAEWWSSTTVCAPIRSDSNPHMRAANIVTRVPGIWAPQWNIVRAENRQAYSLLSVASALMDSITSHHDPKWRQAYIRLRGTMAIIRQQSQSTRNTTEQTPEIVAIPESFRSKFCRIMVVQSKITQWLFRTMLWLMILRNWLDKLIKKTTEWKNRNSRSNWTATE